MALSPDAWNFTDRLKSNVYQTRESELGEIIFDRLTSIRDEDWGSSSSPIYVPLTANEKAIAADAWLDTFYGIQLGEFPVDLIQKWASIGFELAPVSLKTAYDDSVWSLREPQGTSRHQGVYFLRLKGDSSNILVCPHGSNDLYTRHIGNRMFTYTDACMVCHNTVHRDDSVDDSNSADMSRNVDHMMYQLVTALRRHWVRFLELHGFGYSASRLDADGNPLDVIISAGAEAAIGLGANGNPRFFSELISINNFWNQFTQPQGLELSTPVTRGMNAQLYGSNADFSEAKAANLGAETNENSILLAAENNNSEFMSLEHQKEARKILHTNDDGEWNTSAIVEYFQAIKKR